MSVEITANKKSVHSEMYHKIQHTMYGIFLEFEYFAYIGFVAFKVV